MTKIKKTAIILKLTIIDIDRERQTVLRNLQIKTKRRIPYER